MKRCPNIKLKEMSVHFPAGSVEINLDIFNEVAGRFPAVVTTKPDILTTGQDLFPAVFIMTKLDMFNTMSRHFPAAFCCDKNMIFS